MNRRHAGFGAIAALVILVGLSVLAGAMLRFGTASQLGVAQDLLAEQAAQTARAGVEWGLYQAFKGSWTTCPGGSTTLDLTASTGMRVTVSCSASSFNEGETVPGTPRVVRTVAIDAVACNLGSACPGTSSSPAYVERRLQVVAIGP